MGHDQLFEYLGSRLAVRTTLYRMPISRCFLNRCNLSVVWNWSRTKSIRGIWIIRDDPGTPAGRQAERGDYFDAQNNPIEGLSTKKRLKHFSGTFPNLWSVDVARGGGLPEASGSEVLTVRCRFHDGDSVVLIGDAAHAVSIDWSGVQCVAGGCADFRTLVGDV